MLALRLLVSALLLGYLLKISAFTGIAAAFERMQPAYLLGFCLLYYFAVGIQALRWKILLREWGIESRVPALFRRIMVGLFLNNFLPGSIGGDLYRVYAGGREAGRVEAVAATIFYERVFGYGSLVTLGLAMLLARADPAGDWPFWLLLVGALAGLLTLVALAAVPAFERFAARLGERLPLARRLRLQDWLNSFRFKVRLPAALAGIVVISYLIQFADVSSFRLVAAAMQLQVKYTDLLLFVPLLYLAVILPVSVNGIGVREAVFVAFAAIWGVSRPDAVAYSLTVFALGLACSLAGGVLYWLERPAAGPSADKRAESG
jgi:uncharacterized protein (TIRG00374 family)